MKREKEIKNKKSRKYIDCVKGWALDDQVVGKIISSLKGYKLFAFENPVLPGYAVYLLRPQVRIAEISIQRIAVVDKGVQH